MSSEQPMARTQTAAERLAHPAWDSLDQQQSSESDALVDIQSAAADDVEHQQQQQPEQQQQQQQQQQPEQEPVPAALLHLVVEGCYLVLVTAAVVTPTPLRETGSAQRQAPQAGGMWVVPVAGGLLMGLAASAEVMGCCCTAPAKSTGTYVLAVLLALALGLVDLVSHVQALSFCSAHAANAWCGGPDSGAGSTAAAAAAGDSDAVPPEDRLVEWVDETPSETDHVWARWFVTIVVVVLILARSAALASGVRSCCGSSQRALDQAAGGAGGSAVPGPGAELARTNTGTPLTLKGGLEGMDGDDDDDASDDAAGLQLTQSAAMGEYAYWNDAADLTPRSARAAAGAAAAVSASDSGASF
jgi:hypothetical protein